jgi:hypothetical protein
MTKGLSESFASAAICHEKAGAQVALAGPWPNALEPVHDLLRSGDPALK